MGRAARHIEGRVIMYADETTDAMRQAIEETQRRRQIQLSHNKKHSITPATIQKTIRDISERLQELQPEVTEASELDLSKVPADQVKQLVRDLTREMLAAAQMQDYERAALIRDQVKEIQDQEIAVPRTVTTKEAKKIKL
jgi:excinuclease ABC subunit B